MKKTIIALGFLMFVTGFTIAQNAGQDAPKSDRDYLPETGNIAVGVDATPFLNYVGNAFNGATNNSVNFTNNNIFLRYFIMNNGAARLSFGVNNFDKTVTNYYIQDDEALLNAPLSQKDVVDRRIQVNTDYTVRAGYQHFLGDNRLRGFAGADLIYSYNLNYTTFEYGNEMTEVNTNPTTVANWNTGATFNPAERNMEERVPRRHTMGIAAFTGAEYYLIPMLSLGLELGIIYQQEFRGQGYRKYQLMVGSEIVDMDEATRPKERSRMMSTEVPIYGFLYLHFHF